MARRKMYAQIVITEHESYLAAEYQMEGETIRLAAIDKRLARDFPAAYKAWEDSLKIMVQAMMTECGASDVHFSAGHESN